ncbi:hypothetical protein M0813_24999 [Anaeramoeba flamelloides]|uniref:Uncharacterized protein n=1 Tax=Anaeramoeba flamelloides TaxID=1746091 RepID=A0ABQ8Y480_9EUKA|nr:hypothetical protein M0813_24999 [Anaeramoeba flamelloides]
MNVETCFDKKIDGFGTLLQKLFEHQQVLSKQLHNLNQKIATVEKKMTVLTRASMNKKVDGAIVTLFVEAFFKVMFTNKNYFKRVFRIYKTFFSFTSFRRIYDKIDSSSQKDISFINEENFLKYNNYLNIHRFKYLDQVFDKDFMKVPNYAFKLILLNLNINLSKVTPDALTKKITRYRARDTRYDNTIGEDCYFLLINSLIFNFFNTILTDHNNNYFIEIKGLINQKWSHNKIIKQIIKIKKLEDYYTDLQMKKKKKIKLKVNEKNKDYKDRKGKIKQTNNVKDQKNKKKKKKKRNMDFSYEKSRNAKICENDY